MVGAGLKPAPTAFETSPQQSLIIPIWCQR